MFKFELEDLVDVKSVTIVKKNGAVVITHSIINEETVELMNQDDNYEVIIEKGDKVEE